MSTYIYTYHFPKYISMYTFLHTLPRPSGTEWQLLDLFALRLSIHFVPRGLTFTLISLFSDPRHSFSSLTFFTSLPPLHITIIALCCTGMRLLFLNFRLPHPFSRLRSFNELTETDHPDQSFQR